MAVNYKRVFPIIDADYYIEFQNVKLKSILKNVVGIHHCYKYTIELKSNGATETIFGGDDDPQSVFTQIGDIMRIEYEDYDRNGGTIPTSVILKVYLNGVLVINSTKLYTIAYNSEPFYGTCKIISIG